MICGDDRVIYQIAPDKDDSLSVYGITILRILGPEVP
jgi:hypothetical protein